MAEIVPRWEWRTFGDHLDDLEAAWAGAALDVVESDETYLLSAGSAGRDRTVKIRFGLLDVKRLLAVSADGLEQWVPEFKGEFPLPASDVGRILAQLIGHEVNLDLVSYTLEDLLSQVVERHPELEAVQVHKVRHRGRLGGCAAEITDVSIESTSGKASQRTFAVEDEDPAAVLAVATELGLTARPNVSFPRGMKVLARFGSEPVAVIDIGTNSIKFHLAERDTAGGWHVLVDRADVTRLGEGLQDAGRLTERAMDRTLEAIAGMVAEAKVNHAAAIVAVATAGVRKALNGREFADAVHARCGVEVEIISGADEARLAYRAATADLTDGGTRVVFDTGGGSSQFTFGRGTAVAERFSVDVGAVRFTERFGLDGRVSPAVLAEAMEAIAAELTSLDGRESPEEFIGLGGANTNLAAVKLRLAAYDPDRVHGTLLDVAEVESQIEMYRTRSADERRDIVGLQPARAEVILAGACIVRTVLAKLDVTSLRVSDRGLRHGVLAERFA